MQNNYKLETQRLWLNPIESSDAQFVFKLYNDPFVQKYQGHRFYSTKECIELVSFYKSEMALGNRIVWVLFDKIKNLPLGIRICYLDSLDEIEVQGDVLPDFANNGYSFEAYSKIIDFLSKKSYKRIKSKIRVNNYGAGFLLKKLNFITESINYDRDTQEVFADLVLDLKNKNINIRRSFKNKYFDLLIYYLKGEQIDFKYKSIIQRFLKKEFSFTFLSRISNKTYLVKTDGLNIYNDKFDSDFDELENNIGKVILKIILNRNI